MRRAATVLGACGVSLVTFAAAISLPGSAAVATGPAWVASHGSPADGATATPTVPVSRTTLAGASTSAVAGRATHESSGDRPVPAAVNSPSSAGTISPTAAPAAPSEPENAWSGPAIAPAPATRLRIPSIGVDAPVVPVDSTPTGERNPWGGEVYGAIDFPVDGKVRQWVRRGDANSLPAGEASGAVKAFDRVVLYGHASDIGNHLVFQDLSAMRPGDDIVVDTDLGTFTYRAETVLTRAKADLDSLTELYAYPQHGAKEIALVACLPDTSSNVVVLGTLAAAVPAVVAGSTNGKSETAAP